ncbi:MAG: tetratricopeptide repeat protein [Planctomycetota bacterium]|jgi:tetratricopeptide (TPR) repeat protein
MSGKKPMGKSNNKLLVFLICLFLVGVTTLAFMSVANHDFLNYDDNEYITDNPHVCSGLNWPNVRWAFTSTVSNHWHPITWLSHMLDCELFGLNPAAHHLVNLLLHVINTILLFLILVRCTGMIWQSAFVAALFALHPLHVESVAWAAERKDVLSTCFWLLTIMAYCWYTRRPRLLPYLLTLVVFALGLMAKAMLVTLPIILLLVDFWPLKRIDFRPLTFERKQQAAKPDIIFVSPFNICLEKVPFLIIAAVSSVVTVTVMGRAGHVARAANLALRYRLANALVSYLYYIIKMFCPIRLAPFYPHPGSTLPLWKPLVAAVLLLLLSGVVVYCAHRLRYLLVGWLWYLITLLPVIGVLQVGSQAMADRYTYVPLIGLFMAISFGASAILQKLPRGKVFLLTSYGVLTFALVVCTHLQVRHWRSSIALFEHTISVTSKNYLAHNNLSNALGKKGDYDAALKHGLEAVCIRPRYDTAHYNLGMVYYYKSDAEKAKSHWTQVLELNPRYSHANYNLAVLLLEQNQTEKAIEHLRAELKLNPNHSRASRLLLTALMNQKKEK